MPRRDDIKKVMIIGSGPIIIGQLVNSIIPELKRARRFANWDMRCFGQLNPATIMTDPGMADVTYIEPLNLQRMKDIIEKERPDALLPNLGGQTGLNLTSNWRGKASCFSMG